MSLDTNVPGTGLDVGFLCNSWWPSPGGVESHTRDLARELAKRGHRVHVLCLEGGSGREPYSVRTDDESGVEVRRMAYDYHDHAALAHLVRNRKSEDVVMAWLAETPCDVVHVHHATGFGSGALRAMADLGTPLVMTLHDYWSLCPRGQMLHVDGRVCERAEPEVCAPCIAGTWPHLLPSQGASGEGPEGEALTDDVEVAAARTRYAIASLDAPARLLTPSTAAREVYLRAGLAPEQVLVCENGIDVAGLAERVRDLRQATEREAESVRLGVLGTVLPSKGALELARAFIEAAVPGLRLDVHGSLVPYHGDESYLDELKTLAASHDAIELHGEYPLDELPTLLARLDGVVAPSRWEEVYGLTVREARAAGLPVLVSDAGDLPAVTAGETAGRVVARDDHAAWVAALRDFATDADARLRWAAAPAPLRTAHDMMLQLEGVYVDVFEEVTGRAASLHHEPERGARAERAQAAADDQAASGNAPHANKKRGLLGRLFGSRG